MPTAVRILYCHCAYAQVVPADVKDEVLRRLAESGVAFDAVADLCELSAKRDPALKQLVAGVGQGTAEGGGRGDGPAASDGPSGGVELRLAACYPRAVRWLFNAAGVDWPAAGADVANMRTESAEQVVQVLLHGRPAGVPKPPEDEADAKPAGADGPPVAAADSAAAATEATLAEASPAA
jgi:hypothetical protein